MGAKTALDLILQAKDKASKELKGVALAVTGLNQAMELVSKAAEKMKEAYRFAREGAEIERLQDKFRNLGRELGLSADFAKELSRETGGLVNEFEVVAKSVDALGLRLVDNEEDLRRLILSGAQLGFDTNELVLALANQSKRRLDQLGIDLKTFNQNLEVEIQAGMSKQDAFVAAFLSTAENQIKRYGEVGESVLGVYIEFESRLDTIKTTAKKAAAEGLAPFLAEINDIIEAIEILNAMGEEDVNPLKNLVKAFDPVGPVLRVTNLVLDGLILIKNASMDIENATEGWVDSLRGITPEVVVSLEKQGMAALMTKNSVFLLKEAYTEAGGEAENLSLSTIRLALVEAIIAGDSAMVTKYANLYIAANKYRLEVEKLTAALEGSFSPRGDPEAGRPAVGGTGGGGGAGGERVFDTREGPQGGWWYHNFSTGGWSRVKNYQYGGEFTVGGFGGPDSQLVQFAASPGEKVRVGDTGDQAILEEMRLMRMGIDRLGRVLPVTVRDAVERIIQ